MRASFAILLLTISTIFQSQAQVCQRYSCLTSNDNTQYCMFELTDRVNNGLVQTYSDLCPKCTHFNKINLKADNASYVNVCPYTLTATIDATVGRRTIVSKCKAIPNDPALSTIRYPGIVIQGNNERLGEFCDELEELYTCLYGYRRCENGRCKGFERGQYCTVTADCDPQLYCFNGQCKVFEDIGASCVDKYACGRTSKCYVAIGTLSVSNPGVCIEYFSLADGTNIVLTDDFDHFLCKSNNANKQPNPNDGSTKCGAGGHSKQKYKQCSTDLNCNTDVGTYLSCSCVMDDSALKYCPADYGDDEWKVDIAAKFKTYFTATQGCHVVRGFLSDCDQIPAYQDFACPYYKFTQFSLAYKVSDCLYSMANSLLFPNLITIGQACGKISMTTTTYSANLFMALPLAFATIFVLIF